MCEQIIGYLIINHEYLLINTADPVAKTARSLIMFEIKSF